MDNKTNFYVYRHVDRDHWCFVTECSSMYIAERCVDHNALSHPGSRHRIIKRTDEVVHETPESKTATQKVVEWAKFVCGECHSSFASPMHVIPEDILEAFINEQESKNA